MIRNNQKDFSGSKQSKEEWLAAVLNELMQRSRSRVELREQHQVDCLGRLRRLNHQLSNNLYCGQQIEGVNLECCLSG